jgi:hypothetical protein
MKKKTFTRSAAQDEAGGATMSTLQELMIETGDMTYRQLALRSDVTEKTIWTLVRGKTTRTHPRTARKVLAGLNARRKELGLAPVQLDNLGLKLQGTDSQED